MVHLEQLLKSKIAIRAAGRVLTSDANGAASWTPNSSTPAGVTGQLQYNNGGTMAAANIQWKSSPNLLGINTSPGFVLDVEVTNNSN